MKTKPYPIVDMNAFRRSALTPQAVAPRAKFDSTPSKAPCGCVSPASPHALSRGVRVERFPSLPDAPTLSAAATWPVARAQPIYGPFRPVGSRGPVLEVRDPRGRLPPFLPDRPQPRSPFPGVPRVLNYGDTLTNVNRFDTGRGLRFASLGFDTPLSWVVGQVGSTAVIVFIEATVEGGTEPRLGVVTVRFDGAGRGRPRGRGGIVRASTPNRLIGSQGTVVRTSEGERLVASYVAEYESYREVWVVELDEGGAATVTTLVDDRGATDVITLCGPAVTSTGGADTAFLAYATQDDVGPSVVAGELTRQRGGVWRFRPAPGSRWPLRYPIDDAPPSVVPFVTSLAALWDASVGEIVLAAIKAGGKPFLARVDRLGNRLRLPEAFGRCTEKSHGNVQLRQHPVTRRLLLQVHHNYFYFQREGGRFVRYERPGVPLEDVGNCNRADPFEASDVPLSLADLPYVNAIDESSAATVSPSAGVEFLVAGGMETRDPDRTLPYGGFVGNTLAGTSPFVSIAGAWPLPVAATDVQPAHMLSASTFGASVLVLGVNTELGPLRTTSPTRRAFFSVVRP